MKRLGPLAWIILAIVAGTGVFFTVKHFGGDKKIAQVAGKAAVSPLAKVTKLNGKDPLKVCINTWCGFAPGIYYNGGFKPSKDSRFMTEQGVPVQFFLVDDFDAARAGFKSGQFDMLWTTIDTYPTEVDALSQVGAKVFMQVDFSDGGDVMVADEGIKTVNDLRGKSVALAVPSPSSALLINILKTGGLTMEDIHVQNTGTEGHALDMYKARQVQACVIWSPDDQDALHSVAGAHVLKSTKGTQIIADAFYVKSDYLEGHREQLQKFVTGWFTAAAELNRSPEARQAAAKILALNFGQSEDFCNTGINNARLCTMGDNVNFFNLNGTYNGVTAENLYRSTGEDYANLSLAPKVLPSWRQVSDMSVLRSLQQDGTLAGSDQMAEGNVTFSKPTAALASAPAFSTRRVTVNFASNSAVLDDAAKATIDREVKDIASRFRGMRMRIEGNTDDVGSDEINGPLSRRRAEAVADYMVRAYHFDPNRFVKIGNGSKNPVGDNSSDEGRAANRRTDFELLEK